MFTTRASAGPPRELLNYIIRNKLSLAEMRNLIQQIKFGAWSLLHKDYRKPTFTINTFKDLVIPTGIKLVILDKDNCFTQPQKAPVWPDFEQRWKELLKEQAERDFKIVVLSNSAGYRSKDPNYVLAESFEKIYHIPILKHEKPKPLCYQELVDRYEKQGIKPNEILVVGDRLLTDVLMANLMGAQSTWIYPGVHPGFLNRLEGYL